MKIDIGDGKILGTKRVSPNGQISGFSEYAGREVLVLLPEGEVDIRLDAKDFVRELQNAANEHMKLAFDQTKELRRSFGDPEQATRAFMERSTPDSFKNLYGKVQTFVREQVEAADQRLARARQAADDEDSADEDEIPT